MIDSRQRGGHVLVVDDAAINRRLLERALRVDGYDVTLAVNGRDALTALRTGDQAIDVVVLDILMPVLDGYATLETIKTDPALRHLPVIMITAVEELESAVRCIDLGAADYLPKPFNPAFLRARIGSSMALKRMRDQELEYLEQVERVTDAAVSIEAGAFELDGIDAVATRPDALGTLAKVFQRMAVEVRAREDRLRRQVRELQIVIDEERQARQVAEITETDYFQRLRREADDLRRILE